jgi:hypothetical protein
MNTQNDQYDGEKMMALLHDGIEAIRSVYHGLGNTNYPREHQRGWHVSMQHKHALHPAIPQAVKLARPYDWHQLVLEYPYVSETDPSRLAYTRDERAGIANRQTITTIGKYLARHFDLPDHMIREIAAQYSGATCKIMNTMPEMLDVVRNGAKSCMTMIRCDDSEHPYQVYDPELGWSIAVRMDGTTYRARALIYTEPETDTAYFVRSYNKAEDPNSYSQRDDLLEAWLVGQGITKRDGWDGAVMRYIANGDAFLAPYLDGSDKNVEITSGVRRLMTVTSGGEYEFDRQDGTPTPSAGDCECNNCGDNFNEDDGHWAGANGDDHICEYCAREHYTYAYTRHGNQHYIYSDDVVYVESQREYYHDRYLGENNIVRCVDTDEYEHTDDAVYLERESEWYSSGSDAIVYCDHSSEYELIDNCVELCGEKGWAHSDDTWHCEHGDAYYLCDEVSPYETLCGKLVHPEYACDYAEPTTQGE